MPHVRVNLYATLRSYVRGSRSIDVDIEPGQSIEQVLHELGVPPNQTRIIFVNNRAANLSQPLQDGDQVALFPAIGGG